MKGDREYLNFADFIGLATRAFQALHKEGIVGKLKKVRLYPASRPPQYYNDGGNNIDNHLLRCYGKIPVDVNTGYIQDRSKVRELSPNSPMKWHMWSDYPQNHSKSYVSRTASKDRSATGPTNITSKEIGDFFSVELDEKMRNSPSTQTKSPSKI